MKLGEALNERARLAKRVTELRDLWGSVLVTDEDRVPELSPLDLLDEALDTIKSIQELAARINRTNAKTTLANGETITEAISRRDALGAQAAFLDFGVRKLANLDTYHRFRDEAKQSTNASVADTIAARDAFSTERRTLDAELQGLNWTTDLI